MTTKTKYVPPYAASRYARYRPLLQATGGTNYAGLQGDDSSYYESLPGQPTYTATQNRIAPPSLNESAGLAEGRTETNIPRPNYYEAMAQAKGTDPEAERYEYLTTQTTGPLGAEAQAFVRDYEARQQAALQSLQSTLDRTLPIASRYLRLAQNAALLGDYERAQGTIGGSVAGQMDAQADQARLRRYDAARQRVEGVQVESPTGEMREGTLRERLNTVTPTRSPNLSADRLLSAGYLLTGGLSGPALWATGEAGSYLGGKAADELGLPTIVGQVAGGLATPAGLVGAGRNAAAIGRAGTALATGARTGAQAVGRGALQGLDDVLAQGAEAGIVRFPGGSVLDRLTGAVDDADLIGRIRTLDLQDQMRLTQELRDQPQLMEALRTAVNQANDAERVGSNALVSSFMRDTNRLRNRAGRLSQAVDALRGGEGGFVQPSRMNQPVRSTERQLAKTLGREVNPDEAAYLYARTPKQLTQLRREAQEVAERAVDDAPPIPRPRFTPDEKAARALAQRQRLEKSGAWPELMERANLESAAALEEEMVASKVAEAGAKRWSDAAAAGGIVPPKTPKAYGQMSFGPEWTGKKATDLRDEITTLLGLPRTLKASFDLSAPGRQGLALGVRHPVEWVQSWAPMLKAWKSAEGMAEANAEITKLLGRWQQQFGDDILHVYEVGGDVPGLQRVPGFEGAGAGKLGEAVRKIPGLNKSERSYATFLNYQKAKTFDNMAGALYRSGERNPSVYKNLGNIIDHATGFGAAPLRGRIEGQALFSQRYMTSRLQFLVDPIVEGAIKGDWQTARAATENLVAFMGGGAALAMLINESGLAEVELDPRSSEFGKIRLGSQRIDFGAGFLPVLRTAARVATGEAETTTGSVYEISRKNEFLKFFRNKLAPLPSEVINRIVGEDAIGQVPGKLLSLDTVRNLFMPLIADSILEAYKQTDDPLRAALAGVSELFGGGVSTYGADRSGQRDLAQEMFGREFDALNALEQAQINQQLIAEGVDLEQSARLAPYWAAWDTAYARWRQETGGLEEYPTLESLRAELDKRIERTLREQDEEFTRERVQSIRSSIEDDLGITDVIHAVQEVVVEADPEIVRELLKRVEEGKTQFGPRKALREIYEAWKAEQTSQPQRFFGGDVLPSAQPVGDSRDDGYTGFNRNARLDPSQVIDRRGASDYDALLAQQQRRPTTLRERLMYQRLGWEEYEDGSWGPPLAQGAVR